MFIDSKTEETIGPFPLKRSLVAKGVDEIKRCGAKGVVLKFFFDQPKSEAEDATLAQALTGLPVLLQARLDDSEAKPNPLPEQFWLKESPSANAPGLSGRSGWIPLPILSAKAHDIGFVDMPAPDRIPAVEIYQGHWVKSLWLCALELALNEKATITPGKHFKIKGRTVTLDRQSSVQVQLPAEDKLDYIPFHDLLAGKAKTQLLAGKIVILGYDGDKIDLVNTPVGKMRAHRLFVHGLESLYQKTQR